MLTATRVVQICEIKPNKQFRFVRLQDGDPATVYVKIGNTHYRKASAEHGCCLPVVALAAGIRTRVEPS